MNILKIRPVLLLALSLLTAPVAYAAELEFDDAWIAEAPPVSTMMAAYMKIENKSGQEMKLISATSEDFAKIEFHRTINENGMAKMQQQHELSIPAGGELLLQPGGYHMMLFRPTRALRAGAKSSFHFKLANGNTIDVIAEVKKATEEQSHEHHNH